MSFDTDKLLERAQLKRSLAKWRILALLILAFLVFSIFSDQSFNQLPGKDYIATIDVDGVIFDDRERDNRLTDLKDDTNVKAVILRIDSPGGTLTGGEALYHKLRDIAEQKPVVAVIGGVGASGGYMAAIAADYIVAREGSLVGSIGVMLQAAEFTEMAKKLGIGLLSFKSGELKGVPSPLEKLSPSAAHSVESLIQDSYDIFLKMVQERRKGHLPNDVTAYGDGRVFTGRKGLTNGLVDNLGDEKTALTWLHETRNISDKLVVREYKLKEEKKGLLEVLLSLLGVSDTTSLLPPTGLLSLWSPGA